MKKLCNWILSLFRKKKRYRHKLVAELPGRLKPGTLYILDNEGYHWRMSLLCPCGCKAQLDINLIPDHKPYWEYRVNKAGYVSVSPSLWRKVGCKSHFFIRNSEIDWCD